MLKFIKEILSNPDTGAGSSKRFVLVLSGMALSLATIILSVAFVNGHDTSEALWPVTLALSGLAGSSYTFTQMSKFKKDVRDFKDDRQDNQ